MRRLRKILFVGIAALLVHSNSHAYYRQQSFVAASDTMVRKDSLRNTLNAVNPKEGFKNLFVSADLGNGISSEKLNPQAIQFVQDYIRKHGKNLNKMKDWGRPYFDMMDDILSQHGVPRQLKYLAVIESNLKQSAVSWAGAVGPWQFMQGTAQNYGLRVTRYNDERLDYYKSTHAAASFLTDLFIEYGDWLLVIAAYNGGPGNVNRAIRKTGSKDFWKLQHQLPEESMNHVKKFIATHYIMEGEGGVTTATKSERENGIMNAALNEEEMTGSTVYSISGRFHSSVIIRYTGVDAALFNRYNPAFDDLVGLNSKYELRLPIQQMNIFVAKRYEILNESLKLLLQSGK